MNINTYAYSYVYSYTYVYTYCSSNDFLRIVKNFLIKEYGAKKILYATVHMDEKTQHMHLKIIKLHYTPFLSF
ncbi:plasmid recombination protein [Staphylococcus capitis]|nr:plasmid recombination protein [Staphylococcus capitis]